MRVFADLHIHSKYALACSKDSNLENLEKNSLINVDKITETLLKFGRVDYDVKAIL